MEYWAGGWKGKDQGAWSLKGKEQRVDGWKKGKDWKGKICEWRDGMQSSMERREEWEGARRTGQKGKGQRVQAARLGRSDGSGVICDWMRKDNEAVRWRNKEWVAGWWKRALERGALLLRVDEKW
jgi:hypothetical protein